LREINHHIPLVDKKKKYNYYLPKCPDSMRKPLAEKISEYCKAGWWCPARVEQAAPMLVVPKKNGNIRTVVNAQKRNANTVNDVTPFLDQDLIWLDVARAKHCLQINLSDAYEQVRVEPEDVMSGKRCFPQFKESTRALLCNKATVMHHQPFKG
jgi:hypothetical protein